jgi:CRP-like cAMP-binding protein
VIFHQGDPGETLLLIQSGTVKVVAYSDAGDETVLSIFGPGESLGELALIDSQVRSATVQALEKVEAVSIQRAAFQRVVESHPAAMWRLFAGLATRIRHLTDTVSDLTALSLEERLAKKLLELAVERGRDLEGAIEIQLAITQQELADMIGATRPSVNKILGMYETQGLIGHNGRHLVIRDTKGLRRRVP